MNDGRVSHEVHCELMSACCDRGAVPHDCNRELCLVPGQSLQSDLPKAASFRSLAVAALGAQTPAFSLYEMQFNRGWTCTCLCKYAVKNNDLRLHRHPWK